MEEILGYVLSKFLDVIVYDLRAILGNWGCLMVSILVAGILFWFVPAYMLDLPGDDWKTWLVVGPLATIAVVIMVAGTYGLTRTGGTQSDEPAYGGGPDDQAAANWSATKECPHCGEQVSSRAIRCRHCGGWLVDRPQAEEAVDKPAQGLVHIAMQGPPRSMAWTATLGGIGALAALALPIASLVARAIACGPLHSSVMIFALLTLAICVPGAALPVALARIIGRRRSDGRSVDEKDFSVPYALAGGLLGVILSSAVSAICALMIFFPECL